MDDAQFYAEGRANLKIALRKAMRDALRPPPKLTISEWASEHGQLSPETSATTGRFEPFAYQPGMLDAMGDPANDEVSIMKSARIGYALALDTLIPTLTGWKRMGELVVGDVVFGSDGKPYPISFVSPVFTDHECYEISFCDGTKVVADAQHRWKISSDVCFEVLKGDRPSGHIGRPKPGTIATFEGVVNSKEMSKMVRRASGRNALAVDNAKPVEFEDVEVPLSPYALGVWLGDGNYNEFRITSHRSDANEMASNLARCGVRTKIVYTDKRFPDNASIVTLKNPEIGFSLENRAIKKLGLYKNKHVPDLYMRGSVSQRLELLRGLMDTDGSVGVKSYAEFSNTNEQIARSVFELVTSLGMKATHMVKMPRLDSVSFVHGGVRYHVQAQQVLHRIIFRANEGLNPFSLFRKASRVKNSSKPGIIFRRRIVSVEKAPVVPVKCISVESPNSLFLCTRSYIPTHNTKCLDMVVGFYIHQDPSPILVVQPRVEDAEDYSKTEIMPMIRDTKVLAAIAGDVKAKDSGNTILKKSFDNGASLSFVGANSPGGFRRITVRVALFDEIDGYPAAGAGREGDQVKLGKMRTLSFWNRRIVKGSTPTIKGYSKIEKDFEKGDQRYFFVPCPHCGEYQALEWGGADTPYGFKWDRDPDSGVGIPSTVVYLCKHNACVINETEKPWMLSKGEWRATKPFAGHCSMHMWAAYSLFPNACWSNLVEEWLDAKSDPLARQTFYNLVLGLPYEDFGEGVVRKEDIKARAHDWEGSVPDEAIVVVAGVDVQDYRIEIETVAWGRDEESWSIEYKVIDGQFSDNIIRQQLDDYLKRRLKKANGNGISISAVCIDSGGHHTQAVYAFSKDRIGRKVFAIKGESAQAGKRSPVWPTTRPRSRTKKAFRPVIIGVNSAKDTIRNYLQIEKPGPGFCHFPTHYPENHYAQLTAERLVAKIVNGFRFRVWELLPGRANEALDCRVYAYAALCCLYQFGLKIASRPSNQAPAQDIPAPPKPAVVTIAPSVQIQVPDPPPLPKPIEKANPIVTISARVEPSGSAATDKAERIRRIASRLA